MSSQKEISNWKIVPLILFAALLVGLFYSGYRLISWSYYEEQKREQVKIDYITRHSIKTLIEITYDCGHRDTIVWKSDTVTKYQRKYGGNVLVDAVTGDYIKENIDSYKIVGYEETRR